MAEYVNNCCRPQTTDRGRDVGPDMEAFQLVMIYTALSFSKVTPEDSAYRLNHTQAIHWSLVTCIIRAYLGAMFSICAGAQECTLHNHCRAQQPHGRGPQLGNGCQWGAVGPSHSPGPPGCHELPRPGRRFRGFTSSSHECELVGRGGKRAGKLRWQPWQPGVQL